MKSEGRVVTSRTPLRVSLAGGGTDFPSYFREHTGRVVSFAVAKYVYVSVREIPQSHFVIDLQDRPEIFPTLGLIEHDLIRETLRYFDISGGVELSIRSDINLNGFGLGSSSTTAVGLVKAISTLRGQSLNSASLAAIAADIEINRCNGVLGLQDHFPAAYGGLLDITFGPGENVDVVLLDSFAELSRYLKESAFLCFTSLTRSGAPILQAQSSRTSINVDYLRNISANAEEMVAAVSGRNFTEIPRLLRKGWALKKNLADPISNDTIDRLIDRVHVIEQAGAKLCGAGGGGYILICSTADASSLRRQFSDRPLMAVEPTLSGSTLV